MLGANETKWPFVFVGLEVVHEFLYQKAPHSPCLPTKKKCWSPIYLESPNHTLHSNIQCIYTFLRHLAKKQNKAARVKFDVWN